MDKILLHSLGGLLLFLGCHASQLGQEFAFPQEGAKLAAWRKVCLCIFSRRALEPPPGILIGYAQNGEMALPRPEDDEQ